MIQELVARWEERKSKVREVFAAKAPEDYKEIVKTLVEILSSDKYAYDDLDMDPKRVHEIDDGDYQGTLVFVIGAKGYQPSRYWAVMVRYGSCSTCDTLKDIRGYSDETPTESQVNDYMTLALHIVQGISKIGGEIE